MRDEGESENFIYRSRQAACVTDGGKARPPGKYISLPASLSSSSSNTDPTQLLTSIISFALFSRYYSLDLGAL
jgi:hypothetical protein